MRKKIGFIGSGAVAQTLGAGFIKYGYQVKLGSRNPEKLEAWQNGAGKGAEVGTFTEAGSFGEILVLATKGSAAKKALELTGVKNLNGKIIIDATNPIADAPPQDGVLKFFTDLNESLMEQLQNSFSEAHFVKAFNSVGSPKMVDPGYSVRPSMFICGENKPAKEVVTNILELFGWEVIDLGKATAARAIEPLCMLWCIPGFLNNEWTHAFKLLKQ
jgi:predicted dinucleotide-binding enzyme